MEGWLNPANAGGRCIVPGRAPRQGSERASSTKQNRAALRLGEVVQKRQTAGAIKAIQRIPCLSRYSNGRVLNESANRFYRGTGGLLSSKLEGDCLQWER